jgi:hypothetical protein
MFFSGSCAAQSGTGWLNRTRGPGLFDATAAILAHCIEIYTKRNFAMTLQAAAMACAYRRLSYILDAAVKNQPMGGST